MYDDITDEDVERETLNREAREEDREPQQYAEWGYRRSGRNGTVLHASSYDEAITALIEALGDFHDDAISSEEDPAVVRLKTAAWSAFATYVSCLGLLRHDFELTGPDGDIYWVTEYDHT